MKNNISPKKYALLLYNLTAGQKPGVIDAAIKKFIKLISKNRQLGLCPQIIDEFEKLWNSEQKILKIQLTTARELNQDNLKEIITKLEKKLNKKIEIYAEVDPDLIGGAVLNFNDFLIDASIKKQLSLIAERTK